MSIRYECHECGSVFKIKESLAGTRGKCPSCRNSFVVPDKGGDSGVGIENLIDSTIEKRISPRATPIPGKSTGPQTPIATTQEPVAQESATKEPVAKEQSASSSSQSPAGKKPAATPAPDSEVAPDKSEARRSRPTSPPVDQESAEVPERLVSEADAVAENDQTPGTNEDDFDVDSFLMDESVAGAKASAGLATPPPAATPPSNKPVYDKQGRRMLAPVSGQAAGPGATTEVVDAALEGGQVKAGPIQIPPKRKLINFTLAGSLKQLRKNVIWIMAGVVLIAGAHWLSRWLLSPRIDLPRLAGVSGTVTLNDKPLSGVTVHLTPVFGNESKSVSGRPIRLRDSTGITNAEGLYSVRYLDGAPGAPLENMRVWVETIQPEHLKQIPPNYLTRGSTDIRAVKEAGNETRFDLKLKSP